jgi:hypothetical protein
MDLVAFAAAPTGLTKLGLLSLLLTTESLLFAALTVSLSLAATSTFGSRTVVSPVALGFVAAAVLAVIGIAAVLAWTDLFALGSWPAGWNVRVEATALLVAILAQPVIAFVIAVGVWRG